MPAQFDTGQIAGFVRDPSDSTIAGANVTVRNENTGEQRKTTTNSTGYYVFPNLVVGTYTISAEHSGFKKTVQTGIASQLRAIAERRSAADGRIRVGDRRGEGDHRPCTGGTLPLSAGPSKPKQIENLTMNGRNPIYLALLKPGVIGGSIGTFDPDSVTNGGFSINGGARRRIRRDGGWRGRNAHPVVGLDARSAGRRHGTGSPDPHRELQRGVRTFVRAARSVS